MCERSPWLGMLPQLMSGIFISDKTKLRSRSRVFSAPLLLSTVQRGSGSLPPLIVYYRSLINERLQPQPLLHHSGRAQAELLKRKRSSFCIFEGKEKKKKKATTQPESLNESVGTSIDFWLRLGVKVMAMVRCFFPTITRLRESTFKQARINPKVRLQAAGAAIGWTCFQLLFLVYAYWWEQLKPFGLLNRHVCGNHVGKVTWEFENTFCGKLAKWIRWRSANDLIVLKLKQRWAAAARHSIHSSKEVRKECDVGEHYKEILSYLICLWSFFRNHKLRWKIPESLHHSFIRNCESVCRCLVKGATHKANTNTRRRVVVQEAGSYCRLETNLMIVLWILFWWCCCCDNTKTTGHLQVTNRMCERDKLLVIGYFLLLWEVTHYTQKATQWRLLWHCG